MSRVFATIARRFIPFEPMADVMRPGEKFPGFVRRASGMHQVYVSVIAILVALANFIPIDLQRRIVDVAIADKNVRALLALGSLYLAAILLHAGLKYALIVYQGWVGESVVKTARDQLAVVATQRSAREHARSGQTAGIIGNEIDYVGAFVGTSISECVVNITIMISVISYMIYMQPVIALVSGVSLLPQILLALYMQKDLNTLVERQVALVRKLGNQAVNSFASHSTKRRAAFRTIRTIFSNRIEFYLLRFGLKTSMNVANAMGSLMVLIVGGYLVIRGQTTIGTIVAFISGFQRLSEPTGELLDFYRDYSQAKVQFRMIIQWVDGDHPAQTGSPISAGVSGLT
ncbi:ABC transporter ATP-binding protein [Mesorhizobium sp. M1E.F.Ca.ET.045.02.1.1]|uniref:ABC transporter transmembrane domain-containing protein n=1 Tax=unclassified Mesorhizobium TaxID=325217 RepID=UPI000F75CDCB|nr:MULTISPECIES: ABC transporter ATP-binding protein [unclassified Mesorhizobium]AZO19965.1 ABC transporter ATP-binding protein [Mesorhizobium sp. M1E.F.Ca.ET.045.02.1.1]RUW86303.1 ABC transporter ATP-binding protein [Mesorhizobium sp. M1E.F.Ca.ET.063.01.1.1]